MYDRPLAIIKFFQLFSFLVLSQSIFANEVKIAGTVKYVFAAFVHHKIVPGEKTYPHVQSVATIRHEIITLISL